MHGIATYMYKSSRDNHSRAKVLRYEKRPSWDAHALMSRGENGKPGADERPHKDNKYGRDPDTDPAIEVVIRRTG